MPRHVHEDEEMTFACPGCNCAGDVWRRTHPNRNYEHVYTCHKCGSEFDEPVERTKRPTGGRGVARPKSDLAKTLIDADPDDLVTDGGFDTTGCEICEQRPASGVLGDGRDACRWCADRLARKARSNDPVVVTDGGRNQTVCPSCETPMAMVAITGPDQANVSPCGCTVAPEHLPEGEGRTVSTCEVHPDNLPGGEHDELALNLSRAVANYINDENPDLQEVGGVFHAISLGFNRQVGVSDEVVLAADLDSVDDVDVELVNELVDGDLRVTRKGLLDRIRELVR